MRRRDREVVDPTRIEEIIAESAVLRLGLNDDGFELDAGFELVEGPTPCAFSARYRSVVGVAVATELADVAEKRRGLTAIMNQTAGGGRDWRFDDAALDAVAVVRLDVERLSCKENR